MGGDGQHHRNHRRAPQSRRHTWRQTGLAGVLTGAVEMARAAVVEFSGDTVGEYLGVYLRGHQRRRPTASWPICRATTAGSGRSWSPPIRAPTTPPSARSCWCPGRRRCWRRSGCRGSSASSRVTWARAICWRPSADDPRLVPGLPAQRRPRDRRRRRGDRLRPPAACSAPGAAPMPPSAGTTATTDRNPRWRGRPGGSAATAVSCCRWRDRSARCSGCAAMRLAADGHVVDFSYGCGAHSDTPAPGRHRLTALRPVRRRRARRHRQPRQPAGAG